MVYATALRSVAGDRYLADDVTQKVFADFARKARSLQGRTLLAGWFYRASRFAAAQVVRTEQRRRKYEQEAGNMNELHSTKSTDWGEIRPVIDEALEDLSKSEREVILLRYFENRPLPEIGAKFAVSPDAARMRADRALDKLRALLARRGIASTSAALTAAFVAESATAAPAVLSAQIVSVVFSPSGVAATALTGAGKVATIGLWKILAVCVIGAVGVGVVIHEVKRGNLTTGVADQGAGVSAVRQSLSEMVPPATCVATGMAARTKDRAEAFIDARVEQLNRLVGLTAEQKARAGEVFGQEYNALQARIAQKEPLDKVMDIRQNRRNQIRTFLMPQQLKTYNDVPQILGGGSLQDPAEIAARLDQVVALTDEQIPKIAAVYQAEIGVLQAFPPEERAEKGAEVFQAARQEVRALLTPEQQKKFDADPTGLQLSGVRTSVKAFIKASSAIVARLGSVVRLSSAGPGVVKFLWDASGRIQVMKGEFAYDVQGTHRSEIFKVYWEKPSPNEVVKIIKIEGNSGEVILP